MLAHYSVDTGKCRGKLPILFASSMTCGGLLFAQPQQYSQLDDLSEPGLEALMNIDVIHGQAIWHF